MAQLLTKENEEIERMMEEIAIEVRARAQHLVTEDDTPMDNIFSEKQQRLLTEPLYTSWPGPAGETGEQRRFFAAANVGVFRTLRAPAIVPDVFLSLDVELAEDWYDKSHRSYFIWEFGKAPDVVIEIVSNREGHELGSKLHDYAQIAVPYYVVYDPLRQLGDQVLRIYELHGGQYVSRVDRHFSLIGLGLTLWEGAYEGKHAIWLRWLDAQGELLPTGAERAQREMERAQREMERAEKLAARLRELGIDPDQI